MPERGKGRSPRTKVGHPPPILRQAEAVVGDVRALWRELFRSPFAAAAEHGLTSPQVTVIARLVSHGPATLTELSRALGMTHSTASGIVDRLQARGLLARSEDPSDRRRTTIAVTPSVSGYVRQLDLGPTGRVAEALARATAAQRRTIVEGLEALRRLLDRDSPEDDLPRGRGARRAR